MEPECVLGERYFAAARDQAETLRMGRKTGSMLPIGSDFTSRCSQRSSPPFAALPQIQDTTVSVPGRTLAKTASTFDINGRVSANRLL